MAAQNDDTVVMTGGSFSTDKTVTVQPQMGRPNSRVQERQSMARAPFDDTLSERDWNTRLCQCDGGKTGGCSLWCCWCYHKYMIAMRLGETPFLGFVPCATFSLRVKTRTLFGIKGSIVKDFLTSMCCEPCTVCQIARELDHVGL